MIFCILSLETNEESRPWVKRLLWDANWATFTWFSRVFSYNKLIWIHFVHTSQPTSRVCAFECPLKARSKLWCGWISWPSTIVAGLWAFQRTFEICFIFWFCGVWPFSNQIFFSYNRQFYGICTQQRLTFWILDQSFTFKHYSISSNIVWFVL